MLNKNFFEDTAKKLGGCIPPAFGDAKADLEKNFKTVLQGAFSKLNLVTREELDAQQAVLQRTRAKLDELERDLQKLNRKET
jgi:BMFP domain-containing protein YqiC